MTSWLAGRHPDPEHLDELLDDAPGPRSARLDSHVADCGRCQADVARLKVARATLRRARELDIGLPDGLADRLATMFTHAAPAGDSSIDSAAPRFELNDSVAAAHGVGAVGEPIEGDELAVRRKSRLLPALAVAATVAAVAIGGGYALVNQGGATMTSSDAAGGSSGGDHESSQLTEGDSTDTAAGSATSSAPASAQPNSPLTRASTESMPTAAALAASGALDPANLQSVLSAQREHAVLEKLPASSGVKDCANTLNLSDYTGYGATWKNEPAMLFAKSFEVGSTVVIVDGGCQLGENGVGFRYQTEVK